jgi:hypothetical protein
MIVFSEHALERMEERGGSRHEVRMAIREGEASDARHGRTEFTYTFPFEDEWNGTYYEHKELTVYAADDGGDWIVVTVISRDH